MGFGASNSSSSSQSDSYGYSLSNALSENASGQSIYGPQAQHLQSLWDRAGYQSQNSWGDVAANRQMNTANLEQMRMGQDALQGIVQGQGPLQPFTNVNNDLVQRQIGDLGTQMGKFFNEQLMPGITGSAIGAGQFGSGRNQIATGQAAGDVMDAYSQGLTSIMGNAYNQALGAAGMQSQNMIGASNQLAQNAMGMSNLGMANFNAMWAPLQNYQGLLGGPTVLGSSYGYSGANQVSENISQASSKSKSSSFNLSFM